VSARNRLDCYTGSQGHLVVALAHEVEPGGKQAAPGQLGLVQAFLNSVDLEERREDLASPGQLRAWLLQRGLLNADEDLDAADLRRALEVREALRAVLLANNGLPDDPVAVVRLNRAARKARLIVRFDPDGATHLEPDARGIDEALGRLMAIVYTAMADGSWTRLKACRNDVCRWAFYDSSKNRSGTWCTMAVCGNRLKTRSFRERRRATGRRD
jgi:predicted RNA-binding Zn ribbon-like protein